MLSINGEMASIPLVLDLTANEVVSISPASVNPIVVRTLDLTLNMGEAEINSSDFSVKLVPREFTNPNASYRTTKTEYPLNVVAVDGASQTISVKFGGAPGGIYDVVVSNQDGNLISTVTLETAVEVTGFSPRFGSQFGGFVVTINGRNFAPEAAQNPVKIGDDYCLIESVTESEIKCRMSENLGRAAQASILIVFVSTYEEAICSDVDDCNFTFVDFNTLPSLISATPVYDAVNHKYDLEIVGSGITDTDPNAVSVTIGGVAQTVTSVTADLITVEISDLKRGVTADELKIILTEGIVGGYSTLKLGVAFEPKFYGLSATRL